MNICVYGASSRRISKSFIEKVETLGEEIAKRGHGLVFGGGAGGSMGAAARGAVKGGAKKILGISPKFFNTDGVLFDKCTEIIFTETMRERKMLLEDNSDAFIIAPGGIGTFDEFFEIITLKQLGRHNKPIIIFNIEGYYDPLLELLNNAIKNKMMWETTLSLIYPTDNINDIFNYLSSYDYNKVLYVKDYKNIGAKK